MWKLVNKVLVDAKFIYFNSAFVCNYNCVWFEIKRKSWNEPTFASEVLEISEKDLGKRLQLIKLEHRYFLISKEQVPRKVSNEDWQKLVNMESQDERKHYYKYLFKNENYENYRNKMRKIISDDRQKEFENKIKSEGEHLKYGLFQNTFIYRLSTINLTTSYNWLNIGGAMFGQIMVFDLDFAHRMTTGELKFSAEQIKFAHGLNKVHKQPWNLYFCNAKPDSLFMKILKTTIPNLNTPNCLITVTEKNYLDIFPKNKLRYLCGKSSQVLEKLDHEAVYIISGVVSETRYTGLSEIKAKTERIPMFQFPFQKYLGWKGWRNSLPINQAAGILIDLKSSDDWQTAFKHVLSPKLKPFSNISKSILNNTRNSSKSLFDE